MEENSLTINPTTIYRVDEVRKELARIGFPDKLVAQAINGGLLKTYRPAESQTRFVLGQNLLNWFGDQNQL